jgi:fatty-acyl-CoA synthase
VTAAPGTVVPDAAPSGTAGQAYAVLEGGPAPETVRPLEEIVRPFGETARGITFLDAGQRRTVTYHELACQAAAIARRLRLLGVHPGDRVAMTLGNDLDSAVTALGVWWAGAAVVSVPVSSTRNAAAYAKHFSALLSTAECGFYITAEPEQAAGRSGARMLKAQALRGLPPTTVGPDDALPKGPALIQFTSGSTAEPKGVAISAPKLAGHIEMLAGWLEFDPVHDRVISWLPLYHDMGLISMFLTSLGTRTDLVLMPPTSFVFGPARWLRTLSAERGTVTAAPNFAYRTAASVPYEDGLDLSAVRLAVCGGERIVPRVLEDFLRVAGRLGFSREALLPSYGLAESVVGTASRPAGTGPAVDPDGHVSLGIPVPGLAVRAPSEAPAGPVQIRGSWLFDGYFTADGYVPTPPEDWYDTGDDGFIRDGQLRVLGRRAEVIASGGHNVFAEDIELAVQETQGEEVRGCAAFRLDGPEPRFGLMIELPRTPRLSPEEIAAAGRRARAAVSEAVGVRLATVLLVRPGTIPRTTSGKVQRARCRELHGAGELGGRLLGSVV